MKINRFLTWIPILSILIMVFGLTAPLPGMTVTIPGDVNRLCSYTNFFYYFPSQDFIYYLNDRLLFSEPPDERLVKKALRHKIVNIVLVHKLIKQYIQQIRPGSSSVNLDLSSPEGYQQAAALFKLMGLRLKKPSEEGYKIEEDRSSRAVDYFRFALLSPGKLEKQLNQTHRFYFQLLETDMAVDLDERLIRDITGIQCDSLTMFENIVKYERLSLLLGILFRLTPGEIQYIAGLKTELLSPPWKVMFQDKLFLMGMFMLSTALRVEDNALQVPGGKAAESFWSQLAGHDLKEFPYEFLKAIATAENGRLNYLYVFSYFLPPQKREVLLLNYDAPRMREILSLVDLDGGEVLNERAFPELKDFNFYTLLYGLKVKEGAVYFPAGTAAWLKAISADDKDGDALFGFYKALLRGAGGSMGGRKISALQKFMSVYCKLIDRQAVLNEEVIARLYQGYDRYNVLADFIEKIPLQKPTTVLKLFDWVRQLENTGAEDRLLFTATFQSLLEILAHSARYTPSGVDYDYLVGRLIQIPLSRPLLVDKVFQFMDKELGVRLRPDTIDGSFLDFIFRGLANPGLQIGDEDYRFLIREMYRQIVTEVVESQDISKLSDLLAMNRGLNRAVDTTQASSLAIQKQLLAGSNRLAIPDISDEAPLRIRKKMAAYAKSSLNTDLFRLLNQIRQGAAKAEIKAVVNEIKSDYLVQQLRDYLLTIVYGLNMKNDKIRAFLNPNLIHLHDFQEKGNRTPWNYCQSSLLIGGLSGFHVEGGLSRLHVVFASALRNQFFRRNLIYDPDHIHPVITNVAEIYPFSPIKSGQRYAALLVQFGLELLKRASEQEDVKQAVRAELHTLTSGYHRRKVMEYLDGKTNDRHLFFSEIMRLGERFWHKKTLSREFESSAELKVFSEKNLRRMVQEELDHLGGVYYHSFGSLKSRRLALFPQELSHFFQSGWLSGEMINELKIKAAYHAHKKQLPSTLLGQFAYRYLFNTCRRFYQRSYNKDYFSTYFSFDIFNNSHLNQTIKKLKKEGYLRII